MRCSDTQTTVLLVACKLGHLGVVKALLKYNADMYLESDRGITPLMAACFYNHRHVIAQLQARNIEVDRLNNEGETALMAGQTHLKLLA